MQAIRKDTRIPFARPQRKSIRMQRKLFLYWFSMLLVLLSIFLVVLGITGVFSALDKEMQQILSARQKNVVSDMSSQFGRMTAQGIAISEQASAYISNQLFTDPVTALNDDPERIADLESTLYGYLTASLQSAPCNGAFLILDATTNTQAPTAQFSRAGLYLRLANLSSKGAANQDVVFYRGVPDVARDHQLELHNRWKLEFDTSKVPGYDELLSSPVERLAESAVWTDLLCLTDTWEKAMLLMVPIQGNDGSVLGVCGLELSETYFMLSYPSEESNWGSIVTLLAPMDGNTLLLSKALAGKQEETYLNTEDVLEVKTGRYFNQYVSSSQTFLGVHTEMGLRMADGSPLYAVTLIPQDAFVRAHTFQWLFGIFGGIVIFAVLLILSAYLSQSFAQPISHSLELIRNEGSLCSERSGVSEIDELFDYIQAKIQAAGNSHLPSNVEELFSSFAQRATGLTPTEHNILKYYAEGQGINDVAEQACISINTVRRHNANIYQKLGVGSREELLLYIELFRRCDRLDELI